MVSVVFVVGVLCDVFGSYIWVWFGVVGFCVVVVVVSVSIICRLILLLMGLLIGVLK